MGHDYVQLITTALAVLGAVLGIFNAWRNWAHDRVNVRVLVCSAQDEDAQPGLGITVRNLSRFAVTIKHIGFNVSGGDWYCQIWQTLSSDGQTLPVRLESRTSLTYFLPLAALPAEHVHSLSAVVIDTACGLGFSGGKRFFQKKWPAITAQQAERITQPRA